MTDKKPIPRYRRILIDILGVLLLLCVPLISWIPGPGGIPLLIGGLTLLSINHQWAKRLLINFKTKGTNLYEMIFPDNKWLYWVYDLLGAVIVVGAVLIINQTTKNWVETVAIGVIFMGVTFIMANRKRMKKISAFTKRLIKKQ